MADTFYPSTTGLPATHSGFSESGPLQVDDPVDRYIVEAMIGEGATAQVYRVRHRLLGTHHALKVLRSRHPELRERLVQEGRIQAGLRHANVVAVTDVLDVYGHLGLLMDYVEGGALDAWLAHTKPPLRSCLRVFEGIVSGVAAAHRMGIVHRDLKPANVLFDATRLHPWVTDFGLARHLHTNEERRTLVGQIMGTPAYMAPEQIQSARDADARADVFALGAILYELATGQRAFPGSLLQVLANVAAGDFIPPHHLVPDLPPAVVQVILGCLTVHPDLRLPSCEAIEALLTPTTSSGSPPRAQPSPQRAVDEMTPAPAPSGPTEGLPWVILQVGADAAGMFSVQEVDASDGHPQPRRTLPAATPEMFATLREQMYRSPIQGAHSVAHGRLALAASLFEGVSQPSRDLGDPDRSALWIRLDARDDVTASFPWEGLGATHRAVEWTRAVPSSRPVVPRELNGPVRVLELVDRIDRDDPLRAGLAGMEASGHLSWLPPRTLGGLSAPQLASLFQAPPRPHVLIVRATIGLDGTGQLRVGTGTDSIGGGRGGVSLAQLAAALDRRSCPDLRVVLVEPRYRGKPPDLVPALVNLAGDAATAGVFWPWNLVDDDFHRATQAFLERLVHTGDVIAAVRALRSAAIGRASMAMLAMRGTSPIVFDTSRQQLRPATPPTDTSRLSAGESQILEHVTRVLGKAGGYSLFLGDGLDSDGPHVALSDELNDRLEARNHGSLAQLMQRFELLEDREELRALVQEALEDSAECRPARAIDAVSKMAQPGLHLSLTLLPVLADSLALHHPDTDVIVLQPLRPGEFDRLRAFVRPAGERRWRRGERTATQRLDLHRQHVVLRLHGGIPAPGKGMLGDPVLTETDQLEHLGALDTLPAQILAHFRRNPVVFMGFSPDNWSHRATVRALAGGQPLAAGSLAVLLPNADSLHRRYWTWERGPAGSRGVQLVMDTEFDAVAKSLDPSYRGGSSGRAEPPR